MRTSRFVEVCMMLFNHGIAPKWESVIDANGNDFEYRAHFAIENSQLPQDRAEFDHACDLFSRDTRLVWQGNEETLIITIPADQE